MESRVEHMNADGMMGGRMVVRVWSASTLLDFCADLMDYALFSHSLSKLLWITVQTEKTSSIFLERCGKFVSVGVLISLLLEVTGPIKC